MGLYFYQESIYHIQKLKQNNILKYVGVLHVELMLQIFRFLLHLLLVFLDA